LKTRIVPPAEVFMLREELLRCGLSEIAGVLGKSVFRIADAPEIGCMAITLEHVCQIDSPTEQYKFLDALPESRKSELRETLARFFQATDPELNITDIDFYNLG